MKRIVLTDDQKKEYELRVNAVQQNRVANRTPKQWDKFRKRQNKRKQRLREIEKQHSKNQKRQARQIRRQIKIKAPEKIGFYESREWREARFKILRRFGSKCLACGASPPNVVLHVDHIKPRSKYPYLELDLENLQVLCEACNLGKCNYTEEDLRPK